MNSLISAFSPPRAKLPKVIKDIYLLVLGTFDLSEPPINGSWRLACLIL